MKKGISVAVISMAVLLLASTAAAQEEKEPMLYAVLSSAITNRYYGYGDLNAYTSTSFKLINENFEDVTGYINGVYDYIFVCGSLYGIQIRNYQTGEWTSLKLSGERINDLNNIVYLPHRQANMLKKVLIVSSKEAYEAYSPINDEKPKEGLFDVCAGKLAVPVEYEDLYMLEHIVLGRKGNTVHVIEYSGNIRSSFEAAPWQRLKLKSNGQIILFGNYTFRDSNGSSFSEEPDNENYGTRDEPLYQMGGLLHKNDNGMVWLYSQERVKLFDNKLKIAIAAPDNKYIYIDDGKHSGLINNSGEWVYKQPSRYSSLRD
ncbi:MAG: hypothetical protein FWG30_07360 [Eubacteriaceae bacterium]|nr:hypothetical protein [Eubacteriaceae bacterium]